MNRLFFVLLVSFTSIFSVQPRAEVELTINDSFYSYANNPRLAEALYPLALQESWYWPESKLFRNNTHEAHKLRARIVNILENEITDNDKLIYKSITKQIESWEIADRINITIDFELARISEQHNPLFEDGQYRMTLAKRPNNLYIFGAISKALNLPYPNNTCVKNIVSTLKFSEYADKSHVYIISPQGLIEKSPIAIWNSKCVLLPPGALLYIPLQESLFSTTKSEINSNIVDLATNRVAAQ